MTKKSSTRSRKQPRSKSKSKPARARPAKRGKPRKKPTRPARPVRAARETATRDFEGGQGDYDLVCTVEDTLATGLEFADCLAQAQAHNREHAGEDPPHHAEPRQRLPPADNGDE